MALTKERAFEFADMWIDLSPAAQQMLCELGKEYGPECYDKDSFIARIVATATDVELNQNCVRSDFMKEQLELQNARKNDQYLESHRGYVGRRVREARCGVDMSQEELAKATGIHQSYISRIEQGQFCTTYKTIAKLAHALGVPIHALDFKYDDIGGRVLAIRESKMKTVTDLADELGVSEEEINEIEQEHDYLHRDMIIRIARALGVRESQIEPGFHLRG